MKQELLTQYAQAIVRIGVNVQKGDGVAIYSGTEALPLLREVVKAAWQAGAKHVSVKMNDDEMTLAKYQYADADTFDAVPDFEVDHDVAMLRDDYCRISLLTANPELMQGVDKDKLKRAQGAKAKAGERIFPFYDTGRIKWTVAACPTKAWAKSIFPEMDEEKGLALLWDKVLTAARIQGGDAVAQWQAHDSALKAHRAWLNGQDFAALHYQAPGTDLTVHLADDHLWDGGSSKTPGGVSYMPNMPTEEIFTCPHAQKVDGTLRATMPLVLMGNVIEGMEFVFENGRVTSFTAQKNGEVLENMLNMDEGARRLGEVALVPFTSAINDTGILFKETLFDENASCHFALGNAYADTIIGGTDMTEAERAAHGANKSSIHIDFMVGSKELTITGIKKDGTMVKVFERGEWAAR